MLRKTTKNHAVLDFVRQMDQINKVRGTVLRESYDLDMRIKNIRHNRIEFRSSVIGRARKTDSRIRNQLKFLKKTILQSSFHNFGWSSFASSSSTFARCLRLIALGQGIYMRCSSTALVGVGASFNALIRRALRYRELAQIHKPQAKSPPVADAGTQWDEELGVDSLSLETIRN